MHIGARGFAAFARGFLLAVVGLAVVGLSGTSLAQIVPQPRVHRQEEGVYHADQLRCEVAEFAPQVAAFREALKRLGAVGFGEAASRSAAIVFQRAEFGDTEQYQVVTTARNMVVKAGSPRAVARATATLLQTVQFDQGATAWPVGRVADQPDLPFRCFMVDMGRNPHSPKVPSPIALPRDVCTGVATTRGQSCCDGFTP